MTPQQIGELTDRRTRVVYVKQYRDTHGLTYAGVARDTGLTRNQVAADHREYKRWFGEDSAPVDSAPAPSESHHQPLSQEPDGDANTPVRHRKPAKARADARLRDGY